MDKINSFNINKALVALDLSDTDNSVLAYLHFWSQQVSCHHYHFLHVVARPTSWAAWLPWNKQLKDDTSEWKSNHHHLRQDLENRVHQQFANQAAYQLTFELEEGDPLAKMVEAAQQNHADLVVMGRKTNPNSHGVLARNAVRRMPCPVLIVPQGVLPKLKTIVVPIDFSDFSARALQAALAINQRLAAPAQIIALHLYELPDMNYYHIQKSEQQLRESVEGDINEALQAFVQHHAGNLFDLVQTQLVEHIGNSLAIDLFKAAKTADADLILMGAKGHSLVERLLLGSVTERLLQENQDICTLIVR